MSNEPGNPLDNGYGLIDGACCPKISQEPTLPPNLVHPVSIPNVATELEDGQDSETNSDEEDESSDDQDSSLDEDSDTEL